VATSTTHVYCMYNSYITVYLCGRCGYFHHTNLHCMHNLYTAAYLCGLCGYFHHTTKFHCMYNSYTAVYLCGLCGYLYTFKSFHILLTYVQFVYRSIPLRSVWLLVPHTFNVSLHLYTAIYPCGLCSYLYNFKSFYTLPVYRFICIPRISLRAMWIRVQFQDIPHTFHVYFICIPQYTPSADCVD
jgi:hypothetical protein